MEILRKENYLFNEVPSPTAERGSVGIYILWGISFLQHICPKTQENFKTGHHDCIPDVLQITMTIYIFYMTLV